MPDADYTVVDRQAELSEDRRYRYTLWRYLADPPGSVCAFVMLNPSTADARRDDPTIRRCMSFVHGWGHDCLVVVNLYAFRATQPNALWTVNDPVGEYNDGWIEDVVQQADLVVLAWGSHGARNRRGHIVEDQIRMTAGEVVTLGRTKSGEPKHPLYLAKNTKVVTNDRAADQR